jgi:hypothetical protein
MLKNNNNNTEKVLSDSICIRIVAIKPLKFKKVIMLNFELYNPTNLVFCKGQMEIRKSLKTYWTKFYWHMVVEVSLKRNPRK